MRIALDELDVQLLDVVRLISGKAAAPLLPASASVLTFDERAWSALQQAELCGLAIPVDRDGQGASTLALGLACEELARGLTRVPFLETAGIAAALLTAADPEVSPALLAGIAEGSQRWSWVADPAVLNGPGRTSVPARVIVSEDRITADVLTPFAAHCRYLAVLTADSAGQPGSWILDLSDTGVDRQPEPGFDLLAASARIRVRGQKVIRIASGQPLTLALSRIATLLAFDQLGLASRALQEAVRYACGRVAFGRPVGSFQSVKHRLAETASVVELCRSLCYQAALTPASDAEGANAVLAGWTALLAAADAASMASSVCVRVHGAMGTAWEALPHLLDRRASSRAILLGGPPRWRSIVAPLLLGQVRGRALAS
jgi:acyl-CoA dehydrogenase